MGPRAGLDGRKISSPPGFDPWASSTYSVVIPTELPGPQLISSVRAVCVMSGCIVNGIFAVVVSHAAADWCLVSEVSG